MNILEDSLQESLALTVKILSISINVIIKSTIFTIYSILVGIPYLAVPFLTYQVLKPIGLNGIALLIITPIVGIPLALLISTFISIYSKNIYDVLFDKVKAIKINIREKIRAIKINRRHKRYSNKV